MRIAQLTKERVDHEVADDDSANQRRRAARLLKPMDYTESIPTNPLHEQRRGPLHALLRWLNGPSTQP